MRKIKKLLSLTIGFVGCMLAGVFALQTPTASPVETVADTSGYTSIERISFHGVSEGPSFYTKFFSGTVQTVDVTSGETDKTNEALGNFAKQIKVIKKSDSSVSTLYDFNGSNQSLKAQESPENLWWGTFETGDQIIIPQGTTFENDNNGDGVYENAYIFNYTFKILISSDACTSLTCDASTYCKSGTVHVFRLGTCAETSITGIGIPNWTQEDSQLYLQMNNLDLAGSDKKVNETDRTCEAVADWAKQMIFATSTDGKTFTYYNYYDYVLGLSPDTYAIEIQNSVNIKFTGFSNEWDTLIIPQGTTLRWDNNGDYVLDYNWVASQTYTFVRWKGTNLTPGTNTAYGNTTDPNHVESGTNKPNCTEFNTTTGYACCNTDYTTLNSGRCSGWFHQCRSTASSTTVVTVVSETATDNTASLTINNARLEVLPSQYTLDAGAWAYNGTTFTDVCDVTIENGYIHIAKKSGNFAHKDTVVIPAGAVITNTITGATYNFTAQRTLYYVSGNWYSADSYYDVTQVTQISNNSGNNLYVWFADANGNSINNGYNMTNDTGGWYNPDGNTNAFKAQVVCSQTVDRVQIGGQSSGLYFYNASGLFASGMTLTIPQGAVWYANAQNNTGVTAQALWYFPYTITITVNSANTYTQGTVQALPEAPATTGNNVFVGYKLVSKTDGSVQPKLYQPGETFDPTTYTYEAVTLEMYMEKGASARLSEVDGVCGIRYTVNVNKTQLQALKDTFGVTVNLGLRVRIMNSAGAISKTESTFTAITDALGTAQTGNCRESGEYLVYTVAYVMYDEFIALETNQNYKWLGDGFITLTNTDASTATYYAVQNDNARSYKAMLDYYVNQSWTAEETEVNQYKIIHTLSDGSTQVRYYSFYFPTYEVLLSEATRAGVAVLDAQE